MTWAIFWHNKCSLPWTYGTEASQNSMIWKCECMLLGEEFHGEDLLATCTRKERSTTPVHIFVVYKLKSVCFFAFALRILRLQRSLWVDWYWTRLTATLQHWFIPTTSLLLAASCSFIMNALIELAKKSRMIFIHQQHYHGQNQQMFINSMALWNLICSLFLFCKFIYPNGTRWFSCWSVVKNCICKK